MRIAFLWVAEQSNLDRNEVKDLCKKSGFKPTHLVGQSQKKIPLTRIRLPSSFWEIREGMIFAVTGHMIIGRHTRKMGISGEDLQNILVMCHRAGKSRLGKAFPLR